MKLYILPLLSNGLSLYKTLKGVFLQLNNPYRVTMVDLGDFCTRDVWEAIYHWPAALPLAKIGFDLFNPLKIYRKIMRPHLSTFSCICRRSSLPGELYHVSHLHDSEVKIFYCNLEEYLNVWIILYISDSNW